MDFYTDVQLTYLNRNITKSAVYKFCPGSLNCYFIPADYIQESVIKNGCALIIQNAKYNGEEHDGLAISSTVVDSFLEHCGFKTHLRTDVSAEVVTYCEQNI